MFANEWIEVKINDAKVKVHVISTVNVNYPSAKDTYNRFKALSKTSRLIFLPSHDRDAGNRLKKLIALSVN